ncbi:nucleotidyltransferase family protein [Spirosoma montaniterrae]|uniref:4-diphosphocytidyl-2C-methyl-D-erythritol synthase n=1 Tax=Spirosoma montaniterrae TaxID=1178516 RepID=A0A1P9X1M8_9BACT|nr:nucleotidyltransferase family protein [Spirosoma montaniterrae]AQG81539.1 4-diphosphocytidyl-2C-methyl-D-erythritol synthase [Spirosoma montaniterrae]
MVIATILLAAGGSTRLGQPKQLLVQDGQTLVRRMADVALGLQTGPVLVVLGANADRIRAELDSLPIQFVQNDAWADGLASSLRAGLHALPPTTDAFLVLLTDQPFVSPELLRQLIDTQLKTGRGIVASRYGESAHLGVPALFNIRYKAEFMQLNGDVGARKLIQQHLPDCADVLFPQGNIDLDTPEQVIRWQSM